MTSGMGPAWWRDLGRRDRVLAWVVPLMFFVTGLLVYGTSLDHPDEAFFDEKHYVPASRAFSNGTWMNPAWGDSRPYNYEHPPLAKYWFALAMKLGGDEPEAWRVPSMIYGAAGLAGLSVLGRRLFSSHWAGVFAPGMLLLDPMWYVHSRMALLEVFVAAPMVWAFAFAVGRRRSDVWWASAMTALGMSAKFNALFLVPALFLVLLFRLASRESLWRAGLLAGLAAFVVPFGVFFLMHAPFLWVWAGDGGIGYAVGHWWFVFKEGLLWGAGGPQTHEEMTAPLYWLPMVRPTWYFVEWGPGEGTAQAVRFIYAIGNPVVWWGGLAFAVVALVGPVFRLIGALARAGRAMEATIRIPDDDWRRLGSMGVAVLIFFSAYLAFFMLARVTFLYYMSLLVPYLSLMAGGGLAMVLTRRVSGRARSYPSGPSSRAIQEEGVVVPMGAWPEETLTAGVMVPAGAGALSVPDAMETVGPGERPTGGAGGVGSEEPPWIVTLFWRSEWPERLAVTVFIVVAALVYWWWTPLFTGGLVRREQIEAAWDLVPWMERLLSDL